ncbi:GSCFA domain-containing protein [Falsiroseomonas stagni]|uniref:GSCFA family protein n=1 Tax=Falsiroseomonas stagni DSM 19981 TaxID=1123062 RepID=A0A1I4B0M8_9PROT|nr:GSCFA domain-containing protein [Falsiroseomonas stagni]SFK61406.1 GSCFA family protein [Falsiroseomonas stagni DSM 19981]
MASPYSSLPPTNFWRSGVAGAATGDFPGLVRPRFPITPQMRIATAGSCFAQHVGRHLRSRGYAVMDAEPPPPGLGDEEAKAYGFNLYSARYGNIYTVRQLLQLAREAFGLFTPGDAVWRRGDRYFDALRPTVEPDGLSSAAAVREHRAQHLARVAQVLREAELLVFTMGLVEAWVHQATGTVYPTAPGTVADSETPDDITLQVFDFMDVRADLIAFRKLMKKVNPRLRVLLTVSPVPLTATAMDSHVLLATMYAKSTLRAVAGRILQDSPAFDYFPSYELIAGHPTRGRFYAPNLREVTAEGVACVMRHFSAAHGGEVVPDEQPSSTAAAAVIDEQEAEERVVCEEMLLDAFGPQSSGAR